MKLLTLNTHSWLEVHQLNKLMTLAGFIVDHDVDVIALQEVNQHQNYFEASTPASFVPATNNYPLREDNTALILVRLLEQLGSTYQWSWSATHLGFGMYEEGLAILSKAPIDDIRMLDLSPTYTFNDVPKRGSLAIKIQDRGLSLWLATAHLSWWLDTDQKTQLFAPEFTQLDTQLRQLAAADQAPAIILGDFNNDQALRQEGYDFITAKGWHNTRDTATHVKGSSTVHKTIHGWDKVTQAMTLDYIFASCPITFDEHQVIFADDTDQAISDHSGIYASFDTANLTH